VHCVPVRLGGSSYSRVAILALPPVLVVCLYTGRCVAWVPVQLVLLNAVAFPVHHGYRHCLESLHVLSYTSSNAARFHFSLSILNF
jgi:hypothetical protein